jgi:hypothetical protein
MSTVIYLHFCSEMDENDKKLWTEGGQWGMSEAFHWKDWEYIDFFNVHVLTLLLYECVCVCSEIQFSWKISRAWTRKNKIWFYACRLPPCFTMFISEMGAVTVFEDCRVPVPHDLVQAINMGFMASSGKWAAYILPTWCHCIQKCGCTSITDPTAKFPH